MAEGDASSRDRELRDQSPFDALNDAVTRQSERLSEMVLPMRKILDLPKDSSIIFGEESLAYSPKSGWYTYTLKLKPQDDPWPSNHSQ